MTWKGGRLLCHIWKEVTCSEEKEPETLKCPGIHDKNVKMVEAGGGSSLQPQFSFCLLTFIYVRHSVAPFTPPRPCYHVGQMRLHGHIDMCRFAISNLHTKHSVAKYVNLIVYLVKKKKGAVPQVPCMTVK